jgi:hypothetical protein
MLPKLMGVFATYDDKPPSQLVVKCGVGGIRGLEAIRSIWPDTPCIVLIRNPVEVLVSNLRRPPMFLIDWYIDPRACWFGQPPDDVIDAGILETCAWILGQACAEALNKSDEKCLVMDYEHLGKAAMHVAADHFGLRSKSDFTYELERVFRLNSKTRDQQFTDDRKLKQDMATREIRRSAERWIEAPYSKLLSRAIKPSLTIG